MASTHDSSWLNYGFPQATLSGGLTTSPGYTPSTKFRPNVDIVCDKVAWYRGATGTTTKPTRMAIWRVSSQTEIAYTTTITDDGAVGWQDCTLTAPVYLYAGVDYKIACYTPSGGPDWGCFTSAPPVGGGMNFQSVITGYRTTGTYGYPNVDDRNDFIRFLDVHQSTDAGQPQPDPATAELVSDEFSRTFNTEDLAFRSTWLPATTAAAVDAVQTDVTTTLTNLDNVTAGDVTTYGLSGRSIGAAVTWLLANVNTALDLATKLHNLLSANGTGGDTYDYHGALEDVRQKVYDIEARQLAQLQPPAPASWVSQGTQAFDGDLAWAQEADVYTITYTSTGSAVVNSYPSGVDVAYRVLWWAVWDGERMRDRRFADGVLPVLYDGGARMPGIVLHSTAGASGTVEAWTLS